MSAIFGKKSRLSSWKEIYIKNSNEKENATMSEKQIDLQAELQRVTKIALDSQVQLEVTKVGRKYAVENEHIYLKLLPEMKLNSEGQPVSDKGETVTGFLTDLLEKPENSNLRVSPAEWQSRQVEMAIPRLPDGKVDIAKLTGEQYNHLRKTDPARLGLKPK